MVTVVQLKAERKRAFRACRTSLNKAQKSLNQLHRQYNRRLEGHYTELIDTKDAKVIVEYSQAFDKYCQDYKTAVVKNLEAFFQ